ncbi:MAG: hypothetical protein V1799_02425 [bacterium]
MKENGRSDSNNRLFIFFISIVTVIESVWILRSNGFYYIDECAHFLYSRFFLSSLPVFVETWHRPGRLWLFALPAQFGHTITMFFSLALFLCLLIVTYKIAKLKGVRHAEWVVLLTGLQPILFDISYACLAEAPAALLIVLAYWLHLKGKHAGSLTLASAVFLFRFEMFVFALIMLALYTRRREWKILPLVLLGPFVWIAWTTILSGDLFTFFREWSRFSNLGKFIPGVSVTHYLQNLQTIFGFAQLILFIAGVAFITRTHRTSGYWILYCTIVLNIIINTLAGAEVFHWTASIGEFRYIAVVGPFFSIIAVVGFSELLERIKLPWSKFAFALLTFGIIVFNCTITTHPRRWPNYDQVIVNMAKPLKGEYPNLIILTNNAIVAYVLDEPLVGGTRLAKFNNKTLSKYPECLIFWDPFTSNSLFSQTTITKESILRDSTITVLYRYKYWSAEYLLLYKNHFQPLMAH